MDIVIKNGEVQESSQESNKKVSEKETIAVLFSLLESLSFEVMSNDVWWLAMHSAKIRAIKKYGISEEVVNEVFDIFDKARKGKKEQNPMSSMF